MGAAALTKPRTSRHPPPLAGRELDDRDRAFVTSVVRSMPLGIRDDDAEAAGLVAYWQAGSRYQPGRGASWVTFSADAIRHGVQDEMRRDDHLKKNHRREVTANGTAGDEDMMQPLSLSTPLGNDINGNPSTLTVGHAIPAPEDEHGDLRLTVDAALEAVHRSKPQVAAALRLYYQQEWRDLDIGVLLGVCESRARQMRHEGLRMLRELLPPDL